MRFNGVQLLSGGSKPRPASSTAKGFFELFYQWNRSVCGARCANSRRTDSTGYSPSLGAFNNSAKRYSSRSHKPIPIKHISAPDVFSSVENENMRLSYRLRSLMRHLPSSIVVLTTTLPPSELSSKVAGESNQYRGMTLSSFTSLSLTPEPMITFNIRHPSQTLDALRESKYFLLHLLAANPNGARIAEAFTKGNFQAGAVGSPFSGLEIKEIIGQNLEDGRSTLPLPRIKADGVKKVLHCEVHEGGMIGVGDHVMIVARVREVLDHGDTEGAWEEAAEQWGYGLCYVDGKYRAIGEVVNIENGVAKEKRDETLLILESERLERTASNAESVRGGS